MVERVGEGGMGQVYRAQDLRLGQTVALKFLPQELARDPARLEALAAEVRLARQVSHPGVCRVHDIEEMDGTYFLSMEFVDGEDLASLLRRIGRLPADKAVEIVREICHGLAAIHDRGVLHRDLKPANVMIDGRGHARITDFGLAQPQGGGDDPATIVGTPAYMAPEALMGGHAITPRSDLYSLGLVMYELCTGRLPFEATTLGELIGRRNQPPPSPSKLQRDVDPAVERVILRCLDPDPERRPPSALAVAAALPGVDPLAAAVAAGKTPSPELLAAPTAGAEGLRPVVAWTCLAALLIGLTTVVTVSTRTRLLPALALPETPEAMAGRARTLLNDLGVVEGAPADRAFGFEFDEPAVDRIVARDRSPTRWDTLARELPPVVTFWYRESPAELVASAPWYRVSYSDPPLLRAGMAGVKLDGLGRLNRLDAAPGASPRAAVAPLDTNALFRAAGLDPARFRAVPPAATPSGAADQRLAFVGHERGRPGRPLRVEIAAFRGRPLTFQVQEMGAAREAADEPPRDPSRRTTAFVFGTLRPALVLAAMFMGAWIARRNLRAGRGDTKRALRLASAMLALRVLVWVLGGHHTPGSLTEQLMSALAWGLYDFTYAWLFYVAVEPYVRRLWPRLLTSWARLLDGRIADPQVGRDLLVGCLGGTIMALAVAGHQAAPALFGAPPGRPDNVGFVQNQLGALLGLRHQLAELLLLIRSNLLLIMGFMLILLMTRLLLRSGRAALLVAFLLFVPMGLPTGEMPALNVVLATFSMLLLVFLLMRFGFLAAGACALSHALLESAPLGMAMGTWPTSRALLVLLLVLGVGVYGFWRALGGRPAFRDLLAEP